MSGTVYSLIPALLTILLVICTRRVILSLGVGIISAALILTNLHVGESLTTIGTTFYHLLFEQGGLLGIFNTWNMSIIFFLLALGVITAYVVLSGGAFAFTQAIIKRVKTREGVQYTSFILGLTMFIDDYFNALVVGNVSKPLAQEQKVSRARLAYIVDSTSAPICVISPISSWATGIMGSMAVVFATTGAEYNTFSAFLMTIPYHFYVIGAIIMVVLSIRYNINFGEMKKYEKGALQGNDRSVAHAEQAKLHGNGEVQSSKGSIWDLLIPIVTLTGITVATMFYTGFRGAMMEASEYNLFFNILDHLDLSVSLLAGGFAGLVAAMGMTLRHVKNGEVTGTQYGRAFLDGVYSMAGAIMILLLAWGIGELIGELDAGGFLASIITSANLSASFIPVIMFLIAGFMAFATGTSWGAFGILLPIAGSVSAAIDMSIMIPVMAAVLSGAVFGDHASPISDTTLLSSTGSGCEVGAHFRSQLPYALLVAGIAAIGYLLYGFTGSLIVPYLAMIVCFAGVIVYGQRKKTELMVVAKESNQ